MKKILLSITVAIVFSIQLHSIFFKPSMPREQHAELKEGGFSQLEGWGDGVSLKRSLAAFKFSCAAFLKQDPERSVGSPLIPLKAKQWYPVCHAAAEIDSNSEPAIRDFFQNWFHPVEFYEDKPVEGLFTGYYIPLLKGSLKKTKEYSVPIYALPPNLVTAQLKKFSDDLPQRKLVGRVHKKEVIPYYTRAQIDGGVLDGSTKVLAWVKSSLDRLILETEGSGVVELADKQLVLGYAGTNGAKYHSIASILIKQGRMTADNASTEHMRSYFKTHPQQVRPVFHQNKSFVFFRKLPRDVVVGGQGVELTPGYSLAIDRKWIPMGVPLWLNTTVHNPESKTDKPFNRLMIAQDTGGAIRGKVRGDIYWGPGEKATAMAAHVHNQGHYWLLLPRTA